VSLPRSPVTELLAELRHVLDVMRVPWYLFDAQAAILYGVARLTADVDITVDLGSRSTREFVGELGRAGFELRVPDVDAFVDSTRVLPLVHARTRMPVDMVLARPGLEELFFAAAKERAIGDVRVPVAAAEDVITMKVLAGRAKDLDDALAIVRRWARRSISSGPAPRSAGWRPLLIGATWSRSSIGWWRKPGGPANERAAA
jgi:hypothetical protein